MKTDLPELSIGQDEEMNEAVKELSACLRPMIQGLTEKYRQALELTELGDFTQKELSDQLVSLSLVQSLECSAAERR